MRFNIFYSFIIIILFISSSFIFLNNILKKKEHFSPLLQVFNNLMNNNNNRDKIVIINETDTQKNKKYQKFIDNEKNIILKKEKEKEKNNIRDLFKKHILITYNKLSSTNSEFYFYNYKNQLYLKFQIKKNKFFILGKNNEELGKFIKNIYQTYIFNLEKIYENEHTKNDNNYNSNNKSSDSNKSSESSDNTYYFSFIKGYDQIKIYPENKNYNLYIKKYTKTINNENNINYDLYLFEKKIGHIYKKDNIFKIDVYDSYKKYLNLLGIGLGLIIKMQ